MTTAPDLLPVIETDRLTLSAYRADDWPVYRDMLASPRAAFLGGPFSTAEAWGWFASELAQWLLYGHGAVHARCHGDRTVVAQANIVNPPDWPQQELGFWAYDGHEGQGYVSEAALGLRDWYYGNHSAPARLVSYVHPDNAGSVRLLTRLGAVADPDRAVPHEGWIAYLHPAPEARQ